MSDNAASKQYKIPGTMSCPPESPHDRRASALTGPNPLAAARQEQQSQLPAQAAGSREDGQTTGMSYAPGSEASSPAPTPSSPSLPSPRHTVDDIDAMIRDIIKREMNEASVYAYFEADLKPPVTQESLAELDMPRIINNPKLRHDVNFDRELHFRPNLDGCKGKQKLKQAEQYWWALEVELTLYTYVRAQMTAASAEEADWDRVMKQSLRRLEGIFRAIREILKTLVPDYDQEAVDERLDVDHVMQQIRNGVCDLVDLAGWLAKILKSHCAPMRDSMVDAMRKDIESGVRENAHAKLVSGLRQLMSIVEAMKLDVANHQIRHMRPLLIEDAVNFQHRYNEHRIEVGKIDPQVSRAWLLAEIKQPSFAEVQPLSPLDAFCSAVVRDVVFNDEDKVCPHAFYLDSDRLQSLRAEIHSTVHYELCWDLFRKLASPRVDPARLASAYEILHSSITAIVGLRGRFADRSESIAAEMVRAILTIEGRNPPVDDALYQKAERELRDRLPTQSASFKWTADEVCLRILGKLRARVAGLAKKSAIALHDELVPNLTPARPPPLGFGAVCTPLATAPALRVDPDEDLVRRMAHMLVLHWQVWADLVYLIDGIESTDERSAEDDLHSVRANPTGNHPPTVPVALAVYGPGRKWLPVGLTVKNIPNQLPTPAPSPSPEAQQPLGSDNAEQGGDQPANPSTDSEQHPHPA